MKTQNDLKPEEKKKEEAKKTSFSFNKRDGKNKYIQWRFNRKLQLVLIDK